MADVWEYMPKKKVADTSAMVIAPMPGMVKSIAVKVGDEVSRRITIIITIIIIKLIKLN